MNGLKNLVCGNARRAALRESGLNTVSLFGVHFCTPTDVHFYTPIFLPSREKKLRGVTNSARALTTDVPVCAPSGVQFCTPSDVGSARQVTCSSARQLQIRWWGDRYSRRDKPGRRETVGRAEEGEGEGWRVSGKRRWPWICKELACGGMAVGGNGGWTEVQSSKIISITTRAVCIHSNLAATRASIHMLGNSFTW